MANAGQFNLFCTFLYHVFGGNGPLLGLVPGGHCKSTSKIRPATARAMEILKSGWSVE